MVSGSFRIANSIKGENMSVTTYDVITIGAGGGAYPAAFRLARQGMSVLMIDSKGVMSGNCLAEGCVPSKAVREVAQHLERQRRFSGFGLKGTLSVRFEEVMAHKDRVQEERYRQHLLELARTPGLSLLKGVASINSPHEIHVATDQGDRIVSGTTTIIASGSDVLIPPIPGAELCLTSHHFYKMKSVLSSLPSSMIVIGGGYVGLETASFFAAFGTRVTVLERGDGWLPGIDPEIVNRLIPVLSSSMKRVLSAEVLSVTMPSPGKRTVQYRCQGEIREETADVVFLAAGRKPVIPEGAKEAGIIFDHRGIVVDDRLRTSCPDVYACGDVNGRTPLFHAAVRQSLVCAHQILGGDRATDRMDFSSVPTTVFTLPAAAYVGRTPAVLDREGIPYKRASYRFEEDSRAQIFGETDGGIDLFFDSRSLVLLGGYVVGIDAGNLIGEIGQAVSAGLTANHLAAFADQHPMSSEGISKAARTLF